MSMASTALASVAETAATRPSRRRRARAGDLLLADALDREARMPLGRVAVVVRLSRLPPPGPRPYHRRVARSLLEDNAQRHGGQVLQLANGDLVLLAPPPSSAAPDSALAGRDGPHALPPLLARLLQPDGEVPGAPIASLLSLAEEGDRLRALLDSPVTGGDDEDEDDEAPTGRPRNPFAGRLSAGFPPMPPAGYAALSGGLANLLRVQVGARLPPRGAAPGTPIRPAHRTPSVDPGLLGAHLAPHGGAPADPWLRQHLADELGRALLGLLHEAWGTGAPLDPAPRPGVPPLLLRLPLALLGAPPFAAFAALPHGEVRPAIAIGIAEAAAAPAGWASARTRLAEAGMPLVLDGLTHHALVLARPEALEPDLLVLPWSGTLLRLPPPRQAEVAAAIARIGPDRIMMTGADSEAALRWGRTAGLSLFQGTHVEAMLAATRLLACPGPVGGPGPGTGRPAPADEHPCGLRGCAGRAAAATELGRAGCIRTELLDRASPDTPAARQVA